MKAKLDAGQAAQVKAEGQTFEIQPGHVEIKKETVRKTGRWGGVPLVGGGVYKVGGHAAGAVRTHAAWEASVQLPRRHPLAPAVTTGALPSHLAALSLNPYPLRTHSPTYLPHPPTYPPPTPASHARRLVGTSRPA